MAKTLHIRNDNRRLLIGVILMMVSHNCITNNPLLLLLLLNVNAVQHIPNVCICCNGILVTTPTGHLHILCSIADQSMINKRVSKLELPFKGACFKPWCLLPPPGVMIHVPLYNEPQYALHQYHSSIVN